jgi:NitT/TauT family transport system substrate-binding protein
MVRNMRVRLLAAFIVTLSLAWLSSCSRAPSGPPRKVRLGTTASLDSLPLLVLADQGLGRRNGITVESTRFGGGQALFAALAAGTIDAGSPGTIPLLEAARQGLLRDAVVNVAADMFATRDHPGGCVLVSKAVKDWRDLEGSYIAVNAPVSLGAWAIIGRLKSEGVKKYTLVSIPFENMGLAVAGGNVKAAVMFEPFITQSLLRGDGRLLDWIIGGPPLEKIEFSSLVFRRGFVRDDPKSAYAMLKAFVQAVRWMLGHEAQSRVILGRGLNVSEAVARQMVFTEWRPDCRNDPLLLAQMQETLLGIGSINAAIPADSLYDETLLNQVLKDLR